jgi:hypothetical protein
MRCSKTVVAAAFALLACGAVSSQAAEPNNSGLDVIQVRPNFYMIAGAATKALPTAFWPRFAA